MPFRSTAGPALSNLALRCSITSLKIANALSRYHFKHFEQNKEQPTTTSVIELDTDTRISNLQTRINDILNDSITTEEMENALTQGFQQ